MRANTLSGKYSAASHSSACGRSSLATKSRTVSRSASCSAVKCICRVPPWAAPDVNSVTASAEPGWQPTMVAMPPRRSALLWLLSGAGLTLSACSTAATSSPTPAPTTSPAASSTPTPLPPDHLTVTVLAAGVGTFALAAIPVADLRNNAAFNGAAAVVAHFVTHRSGRNLGSLDSVPVNLGPGETLDVTADCTDACNGATSVSVTVTIGSWPISIGAVFTTVPAAYSCHPCRAGHGYGDVRGPLAPPPGIASGRAGVGFAACRNRAGAIIGGGSEELVWPGGTSFTVDIPVVVSVAASACALGGSASW